MAENSAPMKKAPSSEGKTSKSQRLTLDDVVSLIKNGKCKNVITLTGSGISTSLEIPDDPSSTTKLYNIQKYDEDKELPNPKAIFEIESFKKSPKPFFKLLKDFYPSEFKPTPAHYFVKLLHDKGILLRHYTQNVDTLDILAGIPVDKVTEMYGSFRASHCLSCKEEYTQGWMETELLKDVIPTCSVCHKGLVKPDILLCHEPLPSQDIHKRIKEFQNCDLLIIIGASLTLTPFAHLVYAAPESCPRLFINREPIKEIDMMIESRELAELNIANNRNLNVSVFGDFDENCKNIVERLGWTKEFKILLDGGPKNKL